MTIFVAGNKPKQPMIDSNAKVTNKKKLQISKFSGIISFAKYFFIKNKILSS